MVNIQSLLTTVKSDLSKYDEAGLINEDSMYNDVRNALKRFGNDIMVEHETVVEVKDGYGELPPEFFSLVFAYLCEPLNYSAKNVEIHTLQKSLFYRERIENSTQRSEYNACCETVSENTIQEKLYLNEDFVTFTYHNPVLLKLGASFQKDACHATCRNKLVKDNPNEIVIFGTTLQANFNEGFVYIRYKGLPTTDGEIDMPDSKNGHLDLYVEYHVKRRLAERLMGNNDAVGLSNLYAVYRSEERMALQNASNELKMSSINPHRLRRRFKTATMREAFRHESALTWKQ